MDTSPDLKHVRNISLLFRAWAAANPERIQQIPSHVGLALVDNTSNSNLCYAHATEVREDFRTACTHTDLFYYFYGFICSDPNRDSNTLLSPDENLLPIPNSADHFWELVTLGRKLNLVHG